MTNLEIHNKNKLLNQEMIQANIDVDHNGSVNLLLQYNYIENVSMLSYNNRCFYEKNLIIKGPLIIETNKNPNHNQFYVVYFDPLIYYENIQIKYEAIFNSLRRKNSKEVILKALYDMIKSGYSVKILKIIFNKIVKHLHKNLYNKKTVLSRYSSGMIGDNDQIDKKNSYELINPKVK